MTVTIGGDDSELVLHLARGGTVAGAVEAPAARLAKGSLCVSIAPADESTRARFFWLPGAIGVMRDGSYRMDGLPHGRYTVSVSDATRPKEVTVAAGEVTTCSLSLATAMESVTLSIEGLPAGARAGATASFETGPGEPEGISVAKLERGRGRLEHVQAGRVHVEVWVELEEEHMAQPRWVFPVEAVVTPGGAASVSVAWPAPGAMGSIKGQVDRARHGDAGVFLIGPTCHVRGVILGATPLETIRNVTPSVREFSVENLPVGHYRLYAVSDPGEKDADPKTASPAVEVDVKAGAVVDAGKLSGP
jgi:hypothetical protein